MKSKKMNNKTNVLLVNAGLGFAGGVEIFSKNLLLHSDRNKYHFDFLSIYRTPYLKEKQDFDYVDSKIYEFNITSIKFYRFIQLFFRYVYFLYKHNYDIVHINTGALWIQTISVLALKFMRINKIVCHCHSANPTGNSIFYKLFAKICKKLVTYYSDKQLSCSIKACSTIFDENSKKYKDIILINNGIDLKYFSFTKSVRQKYLNKFDINNKFVVGHVGNLYDAKNQLFLIDIFYELLKKNPNAVLVIIGDGELKNQIISRIKGYGIQDKVIMLGHRSDIAELMMCMDVFVLPSLYEGFPITLVEAQAVGLPCLVSDNITKEVKLTNLVNYVSIKEPASVWCKKIISMSNTIYNRVSYTDILQQKGFDVECACRKVYSVYDL